MVTKGLALADDEITLLPDVLQSCFPVEVRANVRPAAIAGPCIAGELVRRAPTCVVLTGRDRGVCSKLAALLETPYYRVWTSPDLAGVEVCAALKNAYAMGMAFSAGLHERAGGTAGPVALHNYEAAVLAESVLEMQRLVLALDGDPQTAVGLAGIGDLAVTCNGGRTGRFGKLLGSGIGLTRALERMRGTTLECREILAVMRAAVPLLEARGRLACGSLPLLDHLASVAIDGKDVVVPFERFFGP
jgi:glycerol-3-phosphate dehydrogenase (NAD(P)+)